MNGYLFIAQLSLVCTLFCDSSHTMYFKIEYEKWETKRILPNSSLAMVENQIMRGIQMFLLNIGSASAISCDF